MYCMYVLTMHINNATNLDLATAERDAIYFALAVALTTIIPV